MSDDSDETIWRRVLDGDDRAFGLLWDRHRDRVFRHARSRLDSGIDAEDATAIAFLELWRRRGDVRFVDRSVLPWLIVVTTNVVLNLQRARRRYRAVLDRVPPDPERADAAELAERRLDAAQRAERVRRLSAVDRHLLALVHLEGFSLREAGAALGISADAAKTRLARVRARLSEGEA